MGGALESLLALSVVEKSSCRPADEIHSRLSIVFPSFSIHFISLMSFGSPLIYHVNYWKTARRPTAPQPPDSLRAWDLDGRGRADVSDPTSGWLLRVAGLAGLGSSARYGTMQQVESSPVQSSPARYRLFRTAP